MDQFLFCALVGLALFFGASVLVGVYQGQQGKLMTIDLYPVIDGIIADGGAPALRDYYLSDWNVQVLQTSHYNVYWTLDSYGLLPANDELKELIRQRV